MTYADKNEKKVQKLEKVLDAAKKNGYGHDVHISGNIEDLVMLCLKRIITLEVQFSEFEKKYREEKNEKIP